MPKLRFCRSISFRAKHRYRLNRLSEEENRLRFGAVADSHEHLWTLTLWLEGQPNPETGMIGDLNHIDETLAREVTERFDGADINQADPYFQDHLPTTETLASYFAEKLGPCFADARLVKVRVAESNDLFAEWLA